MRAGAEGFDLLLIAQWRSASQDAATDETARRSDG
jgi:hypothetical protein